MKQRPALKRQREEWFLRMEGKYIYSLTGKVQIYIQNTWHAKHLFWLQEKCDKRYCHITSKQIEIAENQSYSQVL